MTNLLHLKSQCRKILCQTAKGRGRITYKQLAAQLRLPIPRASWDTVLHPIAMEECQKTGHDLTLVVVYTGKEHGRYLSNCGSPGTRLMDSKSPKMVAEYERDLAAVWNAYANANC